MVEELKSYTPQDLADLDSLMHELSATSFCNESILDNVLNDVNSHAYIIRHEDYIVAAGTLCIVHTLEFTNAVIESVVVSSNHRGQGLGKVLIQHMIDEAKQLNVHSIHLTSNPRRVAANKLYQRIGFIRYETNSYVLDLN